MRSLMRLSAVLCAAVLMGCAAQDTPIQQETHTSSIESGLTTAIVMHTSETIDTSSVCTSTTVTTTSATSHTPYSVSLITPGETTTAGTIASVSVQAMPMISTTRHTILHTTSVTASTLTTTLQQTVKQVQNRSLSGIKIGLDPGHQRHADLSQETIAPNSKETKRKVSGGTAGVSTGIPEYETVLNISMMLRKKLQALGAEVYMTRETHDVNISNQERTKMMNALGVDIMLRIHCDGSDNPASSGTTLYVSKSNAIAKQSKTYAEKILPCMTNATGAKNNGVRQTDTYTGNNWATVPCILMECGFMSNPAEDVLLNSADYQQKLTDGIVNGLVECFEK